MSEGAVRRFGVKVLDTMLFLQMMSRTVRECLYA